MVEEAFSTADAGSWVAAGLFRRPETGEKLPRSGKADPLDGKLAEHKKNSLVLAVSKALR